ncbi:hypothetical protein ABK040_012399 [Willaertia magna]
MNGKSNLNIRNFFAHKKEVICAKIGRKSGQIIATGGEDAIVKVWLVANEEALLTLSGHKSPVTCLTFNQGDDIIVAGSEQGSIRLWDLNSQQNTNPQRTYQIGHRANVTCIDFHPLDKYTYFASGGLDTNIKLWDTRVKDCIQTYKGSQTIQTLKFTPDGKWIVSGGEDGLLRVYDIAAGKFLSSLQAHKSVVSAIDFHPSEFLVATGSMDKTIQVLDLSYKMKFVSRTDLAPTNIKALQFVPYNDGAVLLSANEGGLRVYNEWDANETMRCIDNIDVKWGNVADMNLHQGLNQLIAVSTNSTTGYVGIWVIPPENIKPWRVEDKYVRNDFPPMTPTTDEIFHVNESSTEDVLNEIKNNRKTASSSTTTTITGAVITVNNTKITGERRSPNTNNAMQLSPTLPQQQPHTPPPQFLNNENIIASNRKEPANINIDDFVKNDYLQISDNDLMEQMLKSNQKMSSVLLNRYNNIKIVKKIWIDQGDSKEAIKAVAKMKDLPLAVDVLSLLLRPEQAKKILTLEICVQILPIIIELIQEKYEEYISTGLKVSSILYSSFSKIIDETLNQFNGIGNFGALDLNLEERVGKCRICKKYFSDIKQIIIQRSTDFSQVSDLAIISRRVVNMIK